MNAIEAIVADLLALGVRRGGTLLVHSSLRSLGQVPGGAATVIEALTRALGDEGTLLMPALSFSVVTRAEPRFDVRTTRSNVGTIPETFRATEGVTRSVHPTHSISARGPRAHELLHDHRNDRTPCGPNSPFRKLRDVGGQILMLGCGLRPNTSMHAIEEMVVPPYLFGEPIDYAITDESGVTREYRYTPHGFGGWRQRYDRIDGYLTPPALRTGTVLAADCHLIEATELWKVALCELERDRFCFVEPKE